MLFAAPHCVRSRRSAALTRASHAGFIQHGRATAAERRNDH